MCSAWITNDQINHWIWSDICTSNGGNVIGGYDFTELHLKFKPDEAALSKFIHYSSYNSRLCPLTLLYLPNQYYNAQARRYNCNSILTKLLESGMSMLGSNDKVLPFFQTYTIFKIALTLPEELFLKLLRNIEQENYEMKLYRSDNFVLRDYFQQLLNSDREIKTIPGDWTIVRWSGILSAANANFTVAQMLKCAPNHIDYCLKKII
jgi:hypothetical protein